MGDGSQSGTAKVGQAHAWALATGALSTALLGAGPGLAADCAQPAALPAIATSESSPRTLDPYAITHTVEHYYDAPLGLGILEPVDDENRWYYDWMFEIELPLWREPVESAELGWLVRGQVVTDTGSELLTGAGMVETDYEHLSFIIWETRGDWFRLRLASGTDAWTHRCHLQLSEPKLEPVFWPEFFRRHVEWLHFRRPVPHVLRDEPGINGNRVTLIGNDHKLILLDIRGDWMRVEVEQPDLTCRGPAGNGEAPLRHRGWIKWRDEQGPWIYIYTRGC